MTSSILRHVKRSGSTGGVVHFDMSRGKVRDKGLRPRSSSIGALNMGSPSQGSQCLLGVHQRGRAFGQ